MKEPAKKPVILKVGRETAGRRGKGVTTVFDLPLDEDGVRELAALLKQRCGTGDTAKGGRIETQGGQRECIVSELEKLRSPWMGCSSITSISRSTTWSPGSRPST